MVFQWISTCSFFNDPRKTLKNEVAQGQDIACIRDMVLDKVNAAIK